MFQKKKKAETDPKEPEEKDTPPHSVFVFRAPADSQAVGTGKSRTYSSLWEDPAMKMVAECGRSIELLLSYRA